MYLNGGYIIETDADNIIFYPFEKDNPVQVNIKNEGTSLRLNNYALVGLNSTGLDDDGYIILGDGVISYKWETGNITIPFVNHNWDFIKNRLSVIITTEGLQSDLICSFKYIDFDQNEYFLNGESFIIPASLLRQTINLGYIRNYNIGNGIWNSDTVHPYSKIELTPIKNDGNIQCDLFNVTMYYYQFFKPGEIYTKNQIYLEFNGNIELDSSGNDKFTRVSSYKEFRLQNLTKELK